MADNDAPSTLEWIGTTIYNYTFAFLVAVLVLMFIVTTYRYVTQYYMSNSTLNKGKKCLASRLEKAKLMKMSHNDKIEYDRLTNELSLNINALEHHLDRTIAFGLL